VDVSSDTGAAKKTRLQSIDTNMMGFFDVAEALLA